MAHLWFSWPLFVYLFVCSVFVMLKSVKECETVLNVLHWDNTVTRPLQTDGDRARAASGNHRPAPSWCQHAGLEPAETLLVGRVCMLSAQHLAVPDLLSESSRAGAWI